MGFLKFSKLEILSHPLFITKNELQKYLLPLNRQLPAAFFLADIPTAKKLATKKAEALYGQTGINLTTDYGNTEIIDAVAYYEAHGTIMFDDYSWYFNTKDFAEDFKAAEDNPAVIAHFLHINSGGGLAYYLDEIHKILSERAKPLIVQCEMLVCSAALYIAVPANKIYATTKFDTVGSIGTMVSFWDLKPYFEEIGFKWHEYYAEQSALKNKRFNDLLDGKPEDYIEHELNPITEQFINDVKKSRKKAEGEGLFEGQTYNASEAVGINLIDGIQTLEDSIGEVYALGLKYAEKIRLQNNSIFNL
ncbi:MAG: S49 family peptidase [Prevotellaceae bacterium]|jgi:ClpP class serine protease|nr:S49 family peptidase [Prevotellaceae bacterium]